MAQLVKNLLAMQKTWVQSSGWRLNLWRRKWQPTPVLLPRESHGQRSRSGYSLWDRKVSDMTVPLSLSVSVQFSRSVMSDSVIPWTAACQASLFITNSQSLPKLMSIESVMPSNRLILSSPSPPTLNIKYYNNHIVYIIHETSLVAQMVKNPPAM